jgi:hypothetical protein
MATYASRYTNKTGNSFENFCYYLLDSALYNVESQVCIGLRPTRGKHIVDLEIVVDEEFNVRFLVSLKYQDVDGSAEEKIIYEQICLQAACEDYGYEKAYIVLAGDGWKHDDSYREGAFSKWVNTPNVSVLNFDEFLVEFNLTDKYNELIAA